MVPPKSPQDIPEQLGQVGAASGGSIGAVDTGGGNDVCVPLGVSVVGLTYLFHQAGELER
jgi:hypothetical protein